MAIVMMDGFDNFTHTEQEYRMDNSMLYDIADYIGEVAENDLVVYAKDGDFSMLGDYKKDIWKVNSIEYNDEKTFVNISNISKIGTEFNTYASNLLDIVVLKDVDKDWKKYFSIRSLGALSRQNLNIIKDRPFIEETKTNDHIVDAIRYGTLYDKVEGSTVTREWGTPSEYISKPTGEVTMMNKLINSNMNAAKTGAVLSAGNTLNKVVKDAIRGQVPRKYRGLLNTAVADIVVANVANVAVQNFAKGNYKAKVAANAMMEAAMVEFMNSFNLDQIISDTLKNVNLDDFVDTTGPA